MNRLRLACGRIGEMKIFNSLTRTEEELVPIKSGEVGMYTCGPTVYDYPTIGNWRTYVLGDLIFRSLKYLGLKVNYVMNLTDVGHLTGDNSGDADTGEDRLEKAAKKERKTAWDIAAFYGDDFIGSFEKLNILKPTILCKATDHINEQIEMVKVIMSKGLAYVISDGIYFDVAGYELRGNKYGELSNLDQIREGARVEINPEKKDPRDFALWKFSYSGGRSFDSAQDDSRRDMEWESPWGMGFPGWHIECSVMSTKYLGNQFDLHLGGEDLKSTHHPNEIAQTEAATGKIPFVRYWMHGAFLLVDGGRMGKSVGNAYTLADIEKKFDVLALRYFYLTGHYRKQINFTWESLGAAAEALSRLKKMSADWKVGDFGLSEYEDRFKTAIEDDLNMPQALAVVWEMVKSDKPEEAKKKSLLKFDEILGLCLAETARSQQGVSNESAGSTEIDGLWKRRVQLRAEKKFKEADEIRDKLIAMGVKVEDKPLK